MVGSANINGENNAGLTDDQAIDTWFDMSGNGNNMTAHGAKYSTNKVVLDGSNDYFVLASGDKSEFNFLHHTESTVYVVLKRDSDVGYDVVIDTGGYSRARTGFSYALRPAANEYPYLHISNPNLSDLDRSATSYPDRVPLANTNLGIHMIKSTPTTMGDTAEYSIDFQRTKVAKLYDSNQAYLHQQLKIPIIHYTSGCW